MCSQQLALFGMRDDDNPAALLASFSDSHSTSLSFGNITGGGRLPGGNIIGSSSSSMDLCASGVLVNMPGAHHNNGSPSSSNSSSTSMIPLQGFASSSSSSAENHHTAPSFTSSTNLFASTSSFSTSTSLMASAGSDSIQG